MSRSMARLPGGRAPQQRDRAALAAGAVHLPAERAVRPRDLDDLLLRLAADEAGVQAGPAPRCSRSWRGPGRRSRRRRARRASGRRRRAGVAAWRRRGRRSRARDHHLVDLPTSRATGRGRSSTSRRSSSHQIGSGTRIGLTRSVRVLEHLDVVDAAVGRGELVLDAALLREQLGLDLCAAAATSCGVSRPGVRLSSAPMRATVTAAEVPVRAPAGRLGVDGDLDGDVPRHPHVVDGRLEQRVAGRRRRLGSAIA